MKARLKKMFSTVATFAAVVILGFLYLKSTAIRMDSPGSSGDKTLREYLEEITKGDRSEQMGRDWAKSLVKAATKSASEADEMKPFYEACVRLEAKQFLATNDADLEKRLSINDILLMNGELRNRCEPSALAASM